MFLPIADSTDRVRLLLFHLLLHLLHGMVEMMMSWCRSVRNPPAALPIHSRRARSSSIELDAAAVDGLWYFENMWAQYTFKISGCVGYGQAPVPPLEFTALIKRCLLTEDAVHAYCLLAAANARLRYVHQHRRHTYSISTGRNSGSRVEQRLAHVYARRALRGLN